jgi:hypothetical protein
MSIVLQSSAGGQITIQEPATASNFTQTLPASNGTIITTESPQAGSVIQVVQVSDKNSAGISTTSTSAVATGITISITPKRANSVIRVDWLSAMATGSVVPALAQVYSNGTNAGGAYSGGYCNPGTYISMGSTMYFSPGTTSTQTYAIFMACASAGGTAFIVHPSAAYSLSATEIAV